MKLLEKMLESVSTASFIEDQALQYSYLLSIFRYTMQTAAFSCFEAAAALADLPEQAHEQALKLLQPSDGDFTSTLDLCLPALRRAWPGCAQGWFDNRGTDFESSGSSICSAIISKRNDRLGHGVLDQLSVQEELTRLPQRITDLIQVVGDLLPEFEDNSDGAAKLMTPSESVVVEVVRRQQSQLVLIRRIEHRGSVWRVRGQLLSHVQAPAVVIEISDRSALFAALDTDSSSLSSRVVPLKDDVWRTSVLLPLRQTETFEGRSAEISSLREWWGDIDSRACLVYGEGGIGKTTLVLEFLHGFMESPPEDLLWRPELIFFYSAKLTRWGVAGLEQIGGINANINEALRSLARVLEPKLGRDWHTEDSRSLIAKTASLFREAGLNRDSILLVLDNAETLARTASEETGLGKVLREISTKVAKVLITSRRREAVEATFVQVPPMTDDVGATLLGKLADAYGALAILQAGEARKRKISREFGGKPILLDVLVRHIANTGCGIDDGANAILSQERGDLGAFLFEDAWKRMEPAYRDVFLTLGQLGGSVSEQLLTWSCAEFTCYSPNWLSAFEETRFGSLIDYGANFDITLDNGAREFLAAKYAELSHAERQRVATAVGKVRKKHYQVIAAAEERISDRVARAFRTTAAKAAKLAAARRDTDAAIRWYEEATIIDSANAALFDRFAWYLMVNDRLDKAASVARKARELDPKDADSHFTAGMIAARRADVGEADAALALAESRGKAAHLVALQRARARIERAIVLTHTDVVERRRLLSDAVKLLDGAIPAFPGNHEKHGHERERLLTRCQGLIDTMRGHRSSIDRPG